MMHDTVHRKAQRAIVRLSMRDEQAAREIVGVLAATDWHITCQSQPLDELSDQSEQTEEPTNLVTLPKVVSMPVEDRRKNRLTKAEREERAKELRKLPYAEYLKTDYWLHRRHSAYIRAKGACQVCNAKDKKLNVHHRSYERLGNEVPGDLIVLCEDCHTIFHANKKLAK